jgi:phage N-6-adenine-methyltransferase
MKTHSTQVQKRIRTSRTPSKTASGGFYTQQVAHSSKTDEWATPQATFDKLNKQYQFGLDVCALQSSAKTDAWYGPDHPDVSRRNGLQQDWTTDANGQPIWMNPPYGRTIGDWMQKAVKATEEGATVVCLIPARTDTSWFQDTVLRLQDEGRADIEFVRGRLKFGNAKNSAPFPSLIVTLRPARTPSNAAQSAA